MTHKSKNRLLYFFIGLFVLLAPTIVLYASGWRFDFANFRLVKIGGIFVKDAPAEAQVTIDNKSAESGIRKLLTGALIGNLLPNAYRLKIELPDYYVWERNVVVRPSVVTEIGPIVLVPKKEPEALLEKSLDDFWISGSTLVYRESSGNFFLTNVKNLNKRVNLTLLFNDLKERLLDYPGFVPIVKLTEQESENVWLVNTARAAYLLNVEKPSLQILPAEPETGKPDLAPAEQKILNEFKAAAGTVDDLSRHPKAGYLFARTGPNLYLLDLDIRFPLDFRLIASGIKKHDYEGGRLYMLTYQGIVFLDL